MTTEQIATHKEHHLATEEGLDLYAQSWYVDTPKAVVAMVHGIAEHGTRYRHVAAYLNRHGYDVHTFDLRGHGRSPGPRSLFHHMDEHCADVDCFLDWVEGERHGRPLFLLGHSMGGLIATYYILTQHPTLQGVILSAPAVKLQGVSPLLVAVGRVVAAVLPAVPMRQLEFAGISRDPAVLEENRNDPLVYHGGIPAATGLAMVRAVTYVQHHFAEFQLPVLILHGTADRMVSPEGSKEFYEKVQSTDKTLKFYKGLYHEIFNEPEKEEIFADICTWLDERLDVPSLSRQKNQTKDSAS